jgi:hypothetical protein
MRKLRWVLSMLAILSLTLGAVVVVRGEESPFPAAHAELLSGASYDALFGEAYTPIDAMQVAFANVGQALSSFSDWDMEHVVVGPNVRVNAAQTAAPFGRSETSIAAGADGHKLVAGWNDAEGFLYPPFAPGVGAPGLSGYGYSSDGGLSWTDGGVPPVFGGEITRGDPWLDRGGKDRKTFFYANLAVNAAGAGLGISVHRGHFTGANFAWENARTFNSPNPNDFYDKEAIAVDKRGWGVGYVSLTNFIELCGLPAFGFGQIEVWRTKDGGDTWLGPAIAGPDLTDITDPADPNCGLSGVLLQSSAPAIGPRGEVYVVWQRGPTFNLDGTISTDADIIVARSLDGGVHFDPPVKVADINSMRQNPPVGYNRSRINDHPRIAVVQSGGHRGAIYVVFASAVAPVAAGSTVQSLTSSQVYISYSEDRGLTWSTPQPVAPPVPDTGVKRFWPVVNVEGEANVYVTYYESRETQATPDPLDEECNISIGGGLRRRGPNSSLVDSYLARSHTATWTWEPPVKVSTATSNWCTTLTSIRPNFGDYIDSATVGSHVFPFWADGRNGVPDAFFSNVEIK